MSLNNARAVLRNFAARGDGMPVSYAQAFIEIAADPGLSITTLAERVGMPLSTVSRIVAALADPKKYNLVTVVIAQDEKRRKVVGLTGVGQKLAKEL
jgi:DNA-binding MarR family transcriptional regulator